MGRLTSCPQFGFVVEASLMSFAWLHVGEIAQSNRKRGSAALAVPLEAEKPLSRQIQMVSLLATTTLVLATLATSQVDLGPTHEWCMDGG